MEERDKRNATERRIDRGTKDDVELESESGDKRKCNRKCGEEEGNGEFSASELSTTIGGHNSAIMTRVIFAARAS